MRLTKIITHTLAAMFMLSLAPILTDNGKVLAQSSSFAEIFRSSEGKAKFSRTFIISDTSIPYTITLTHSNRDGSQHAKKATIILNGTEVATLRKTNCSLVAAVRLQQNNEINLMMKGGSAEAQISVAIEPTRTLLLNSPADLDFNSKQEGIGCSASRLIPIRIALIWQTARTIRLLNSTSISMMPMSRVVLRM